ncbi:MAG: hypothetical protein GY857_13300 [Desulfobacula sp.]|nr:hypothetical protein [Desulfobacula sp.]
MQLREEEKKISKYDLAKYLNIDVGEIKNLITNGLLPQSINEDRFFSSDLLLDLKKWDPPPHQFRLKKDNESYFKGLITSILVEESGGFFVVSSDIYPSKFDGMFDMLERYGIWNAQGLNNHIHLNEIAENPIYQMALADKIIKSWHIQLCKMKLSKKCIVYWNGIIDSTICIYMKNGVSDTFLRKYDIQLGIKNISVKNISNEGMLPDLD